MPLPGELFFVQNVYYKLRYHWTLSSSYFLLKFCNFISANLWIVRRTARAALVLISTRLISKPTTSQAYSFRGRATGELGCTAAHSCCKSRKSEVEESLKWGNISCTKIKPFLHGTYCKNTCNIRKPWTCKFVFAHLLGMASLLTLVDLCVAKTYSPRLIQGYIRCQSSAGSCPAWLTMAAILIRVCALQLCLSQSD